MTAEERLRERAYGLGVGWSLQSDLREVLSTLDALRTSYEERGQALAAIRPTCETCAAMFQYQRVMYCRRASDIGSEGLPCDRFNNGCFAHTPKAGT